MDTTTTALVGLIAPALLFDFTNGFHDSANAIATVTTHVLRLPFGYGGRVDAPSAGCPHPALSHGGMRIGRVPRWPDLDQSPPARCQPPPTGVRLD